MRKLYTGATAITAALIGICVSLPAKADSVANFYARTPLTFIVSAGAGGGFDLYSRMLMAHMPRHIAGTPSVVIRNMPGAGGVKGANYLYNVAAKDGSVIAMPLSAIIISEALSPDKVKYKARDFRWIGTISTETDVIGVRADAGVATIEGAKSKTVIVGSTSQLSQNHLHPALVNALLGTKFRIVGGYKSANDILLAQERGEVQAFSGTWSLWVTKRAGAIADGSLKFIVQFGPKLPELRGVPTFAEFVKTPKERSLVEFLELMQYMGRSIAAPPGVAKDFVAALREAFNRTMKDPAFIAAMKAKNLQVSPRTGIAFQADLDRIMPSVVETARTLKAVLRIE